jgi:hypothetical protein
LNICFHFFFLDFIIFFLFWFLQCFPLQTFLDF